MPASQTLRHVADQFRPKSPKLAALIDDSEVDVLPHMDFPAQHRSVLHPDIWTQGSGYAACLNKAWSQADLASSVLR